MDTLHHSYVPVTRTVPRISLRAMTNRSSARGRSRGTFMNKRVYSTHLSRLEWLDPPINMWVVKICTGAIRAISPRIRLGWPISLDQGECVEDDRSGVDSLMCAIST